MASSLQRLEAAWARLHVARLKDKDRIFGLSMGAAPLFKSDDFSDDFKKYINGYPIEI